MKPPYFSIEQILEMIDEPNYSACLRIYSENYSIFQEARGSLRNHQAWVGGYLNHVQESLNIAILFYNLLNSIRSLNFSLSDALVVIFLHDIEKPWKYRKGKNGETEVIPELQTREARDKFRFQKIKDYGIVLSSEQENGLKYIEGEVSNYTNKERVMSPLAAFCHLADIVSARIWFNHPLEQNDFWTGSSRSDICT